MVNLSWFRRPGTASTLTPRDGTVHAWMTSAPVTSIRISMFIGRTTRLSTSSKRNSPFIRSEVGIIYESISMSMKSVYSYLQYHWWPMDLIVNLGFLDSSVRYRIRREGSARKIKMIAGKIVHTVSICWASIK